VGASKIWHLDEHAGGAFAVLVLRALYPDVTPEEAATVLVPHQDDGRAGDVLVATTTHSNVGSR